MMIVLLLLLLLLLFERREEREGEYIYHILFASHKVKAHFSKHPNEKECAREREIEGEKQKKSYHHGRILPCGRPSSAVHLSLCSCGFCVLNSRLYSFCEWGNWFFDATEKWVLFSLFTHTFVCTYYHLRMLVNHQWSRKMTKNFLFFGVKHFSLVRNTDFLACKKRQTSDQPRPLRFNSLAIRTERERKRARDLDRDR